MKVLTVLFLCTQKDEQLYMVSYPYPYLEHLHHFMSHNESRLPLKNHQPTKYEVLRWFEKTIGKIELRKQLWCRPVRMYCHLLGIVSVCWLSCCTTWSWRTRFKSFTVCRVLCSHVLWRQRKTSANFYGVDLISTGWFWFLRGGFDDNCLERCEQRSGEQCTGERSCTSCYVFNPLSAFIFLWRSIVQHFTTAPRKNDFTENVHNGKVSRYCRGLILAKEMISIAPFYKYV